MKRKQFKVISLLTSMIIGIIVGYSVLTGNPILGVASLLAGMAVMYISKRKLKDIIEDERIRQISQKASWTTLQLTALSFAIGGTVLITLKDTYPEYTDIGFFMAYASCVVLVLYSLFYMYYNREYGG